MNKHALYDLIATVGRIGRIPGAPGTWGSIVAVLVWYFWLSQLNWILLLVIIILLSIIGIFVSTQMERLTGKIDPGYIIIDEVAGQWIALILVPVEPLTAGIAFVLFRIFDIIKPWPVGKSQDLPGGWGIMADDILAGLFALGLTHLFVWYIL